LEELPRGFFSMLRNGGQAKRGKRYEEKELFHFRGICSGKVRIFSGLPQGNLPSKQFSTQNRPYF
jgi:hypothetical protein